MGDKEDKADKGETYLLAVAESEANSKYDLLTTVLHELAHLYGFIEGYTGFDNRVKGETFIGDNFTATLDGEHLDKQAHPYDLLNTHLAPGMRKLPSELDVEILRAIASVAEEAEGAGEAGGENPTAKLTSDPLLAITNGDFSISDPTSDNFGWNTRGASNIENGQAILTEDSPFLSNFTQTFTIPESAKTLQFTLADIELGKQGSNASLGSGGAGENTNSDSPLPPSTSAPLPITPPDAFEVALLDTKTNQPLTTYTDLTNTDSLLNIQTTVQHTSAKK